MQSSVVLAQINERLNPPRLVGRLDGFADSDVRVTHDAPAGGATEMEKVTDRS